MSKVYCLRDEQARLIATGSREEMYSFAKHHVVDGMYSIGGPGPDFDLLLYRVGGVIYPCGGVVDGEKVPTLSKQECIGIYGLPKGEQ